MAYLNSTGPYSEIAITNEEQEAVEYYLRVYPKGLLVQKMKWNAFGRLDRYKWLYNSYVRRVAREADDLQSYFDLEHLKVDLTTAYNFLTEEEKKELGMHRVPTWLRPKKEGDVVTVQ